MIDLSQSVRIRQRRWLPSWLISAVLHSLVLLVLGLFSFAVSKKPPVWIRGALSVEPDAAFELSELDATSVPSASLSPDAIDDRTVFLVVDSSTHRMSVSVAPAVALEMDLTASNSRVLQSLATESLRTMGDPIVLTRLDSHAALSRSLEGRSAEQRAILLSKHGGSEASEAAVERALGWIADHQADDGGWSFAHHQICNGQCDHPGRFTRARNGATAMGLLPFLGAGYTHQQGEYSDTVDDGLQYLVTHIERPNPRSINHASYGSWFEPEGTMYSHALATIAMCEAYAMTGDSTLRAPAQAGLDFLVQAQSKADGGWRYSPGAAGDTSAVGWALMALKSGKIAGLEVPQTTFDRSSSFLNRVSSNRGSTYGYVSPNQNPHGLYATSSIGLLCRMYQGWPKQRPGISKGVLSLTKMGPRLDNFYYCYYATQVMHHHGGEPWEQWNARMRDPLIERQFKVGHARGSWTPNGMPEMGGMMGGRLYATSLATMILEVYYRHMPLYTEQALEDDFEL